MSTVGSPKVPQRIAWHRPTGYDDTDAALDWNSSIFGGFDPWTKRKVTLLFQHHGLDLALPGAEGMVDYPREDGGEGKVEYPSSSFGAAFSGVRIENGNWSLAVAKADGRFTWQGDEPLEARATAWEAIIARGFGAWAVFDLAVPDMRIGLSWPELYLRFMYGDFEFQEAATTWPMKFGVAGAGVSLLGIRMTIGDLLFAEIRAGDLSIHAAVSYIDPGGDLDKDIVLRDVARLELAPRFRVGFAL